MKNKIKKIKCKIENGHNYDTFVIYHVSGIKLKKCNNCGKLKKVRLFKK